MNELLTEENAHVVSFFQRLDDIEENVRSLSLNRKPVLNGECYLTIRNCRKVESKPQNLADIPE